MWSRRTAGKSDFSENVRMIRKKQRNFWMDEIDEIDNPFVDSIRCNKRGKLAYSSMLPTTMAVRASLLSALCLLLILEGCSGEQTSAAAGAMSTPPSAEPAFKTEGPVLSITLKDPFQSPDASLLSSGRRSSAADEDIWESLAFFNPTFLWTIRSTRPPLRDSIPSILSCQGVIGYRYDDIRNLPSFLDGDMLIDTPAGILEVRPSYEVKSQRTNVSLRLADKRARSSLSLSAKLSSKTKRGVETVGGSYQSSAPSLFSNMVKCVTFEPSFNVEKKQISANIMTESISGRTKSILKWNTKDPTLTLVHAIDQRNTLSPEISLPTGKITINLDSQLDSGSLSCRIDPSELIQLKWTDQSSSGKWVVDATLPLEAAGGPIAADVRVRRQFVF